MRNDLVIITVYILSSFSVLRGALHLSVDLTELDDNFLRRKIKINNVGQFSVLSCLAPARRGGGGLVGYDEMR